MLPLISSYLCATLSVLSLKDGPQSRNMYQKAKVINPLFPKLSSVCNALAFLIERIVQTA